MTRQEQYLLKRLNRTGKLFGFLRLHRDELFDQGFQAELESMYRDTGAGREPVPPALLAMAVLLQGYHGISDAIAVHIDMRARTSRCPAGEVESFEPGSVVEFDPEACARCARTSFPAREGG